MSNNIPDIKQLIIKYITLGIVIVLLMTFFSFIFCLAYNSNLLSVCPKLDIAKLFLQNMRFNLSVISYASIPVFLIFLIAALSKIPSLSKYAVSAINIYCFIVFSVIFFFHASTLALHHLLSKTIIDNIDFIAQLSVLYTLFDKKYMIIMILPLSLLIITITIFFILLCKYILQPIEYAIKDSKRLAVSMFIMLILCIFFAKGKIIGHLGEADTNITPSIQLNRYVYNGPYSVIGYFKNFDVKNIALYSQYYKNYEKTADGFQDVDLKNYNLNLPELAQQKKELKEELYYLNQDKKK